MISQNMMPEPDGGLSSTERTTRWTPGDLAQNDDNGRHSELPARGSVRVAAIIRRKLEESTRAERQAAAAALWVRQLAQLPRRQEDLLHKFS